MIHFEISQLCVFLVKPATFSIKYVCINIPYSCSLGQTEPNQGKSGECACLYSSGDRVSVIHITFSERTENR